MKSFDLQSETQCFFKEIKVKPGLHFCVQSGKDIFVAWDNQWELLELQS